MPTWRTNRYSGATTGALVAESVCHIVSGGRAPITASAGQLGMAAAVTVWTLSHVHVDGAERPSTFGSAHLSAIPPSLLTCPEPPSRMARLTEPFGTIAVVVLPDLLSLGPTPLTAG